MSIFLLIDGESQEIKAETASIGASPENRLTFSGDERVRARHARIRRVAVRWMVEGIDGAEIQVGQSAPGRMHWLSPGDVIRLSATGPEFTFQSATIDEEPAQPTLRRPVLVDRIPATDERPPPPVPTPSGSGSEAVSPRTHAVSITSFEAASVSPPSVPEINPVEVEDLRTPHSEVRLAPETDELPRPKAKAIPWAEVEPDDSSYSIPLVATPEREEPVVVRRSARTGRRSPWPALLGMVGLMVAATALGLYFSPPRSEPPADTNETDPVEPPRRVAEQGRVNRFVPEQNRQPVIIPPPQRVDVPRRDPMPVVPDKPDDGAINQALAVVGLTHRESQRTFRLGTAWVFGPRKLVTSGAILRALDELDSSDAAPLVLLADGRRLSIVRRVIHPQFKDRQRAVDEAERTLTTALAAAGDDGRQARMRDAEERLRTAREELAVVDIGVLFVVENLPAEFSLGERGGDSSVRLAGLPFPADAFRLVGEIPEPRYETGRTTHGGRNVTISSVTQRGQNWVGSPVLNARNQVIGIISDSGAHAADQSGSQRITPVQQVLDIKP